MDMIWCGSEASYWEAVEAKKQVLAKLSSDPKAYDDREDEKSSSPFLSVVDGVGIITIQGTLLDGKFGRIGTYYGIVGYSDIQEALVQAASSADVRSVLLVVKSGGGAVAGVNETAQLIANLDAVKPVVAYSPSTMASAALWLGVAARKVYASSTAVVGSVGTLQVVSSQHRMLKELGIDAKVVRSGEDKALGHPVDELSEKALSIAEGQAVYLADIFLEHVANRRSMAVSAAKAKYGKGGVFIGEQAKAAGLVDDVMSYSQAFLQAKATAPADNKPRILAKVPVSGNLKAETPSQTLHNAATTTPAETSAGENLGKPMLHIPSAEELAALAAAAGVDPSATPVAPDQGTAGDEGSTQNDISTELTAQVQSLSEQVVAVTAKSAEAEAKVATMTAEAESFMAQVAELTAKIADLTAVAEQADALAAVVKTSVNAMAVALGQQKRDFEKASLADVLAAHAEVGNLFKAKIKSGGVAATKKEAEPEKLASVNPMFLAAAQLSQLTKRKGA